MELGPSRGVVDQAVAILDLPSHQLVGALPPGPALPRGLPLRGRVCLTQCVSILLQLLS